MGLFLVADAIATKVEKTKFKIGIQLLHSKFIYSFPEGSLSFNSSKMAVIVGLRRVNFLTVKSSAFLFASRRLFSELSNASFVFWRCVIVLSISSIAVLNFLEARS